MRWWLLAFLAAGCNELLGLDATYGEGSDPDRDGVLSPDDNCPMVANPDQGDADEDEIGDVCDGCPAAPGPCECFTPTGADADGDGIDDGCDLCPRGVNHDEDHDSYFDGCDVCPGIAGGQEDADADEVGDACDRSGTERDVRTFFDAFAPPQLGWSSPWAGWERELSEDGSVVNHEATTELSLDPGYSNSSTTITSYNWRVEVGIIVPAMAGPGAELGFAMRRSADDKGMGCFLHASGTEWELVGFASPGSVTAPAGPIAPGTPVVLVAHTLDPTGFAIRCELVGVATTSEVAAPESPFPGSLYLVSTIDGAEFTHVFTTTTRQL